MPGYVSSIERCVSTDTLAVTVSNRPSLGSAFGLETSLFNPGDPVLIVGGIDTFHRFQIGKATTIVEGPTESRFYYPSGWYMTCAAYTVDFTEVHRDESGAHCCTYLYREQDLMPLRGDNHEESKEKEKARPKACRHL